MTNTTFQVGHLYVFDETVIGLCTKAHESENNFSNTVNRQGLMLTPEERRTMHPTEWREVTDEERRWYFDQMANRSGYTNDHYDGEDALKAGTVCLLTVDGVEGEYMCILCTDSPSGSYNRPTNTMMTYSLTDHTSVEQCPWNDGQYPVRIHRPTDEQTAEFWEYWNEESRRGNTL